MERMIHARPPDRVIERTVQVAGIELFWLAPIPLAVSCVPARAEHALKLLASLDGDGVLGQADRRARLAPGQFTWLDSDAPFELTMAPARQFIVRFPRALVQSRHPEIDVRTAVARGDDHAGERVVAGLIRQIAHDGLALSDAACAAAIQVLVEAIGMCAAAAPRDAARVRVDRALAQIELQLGDPALDPQALAHHQGVSRRYLDHVVQQATGRSLATHVRVRRLERAAQDLQARPDDHAGEIAARWGFVDASHFTRRFRAHFGVTPTAYRARAG